MPAEVQIELAYDQLIRALLPLELTQVQLLHPQTLQAGLEMAADRKCGVYLAGGDQSAVTRAVRDAEGRHFKYYLCGLSSVRTNHSALQWLLAFKEPEGQVAQWLDELQLHNFRVEQRALAQHSNTDSLSSTCPAEGCMYFDKRERLKR